MTTNPTTVAFGLAVAAALVIYHQRGHPRPSAANPGWEQSSELQQVGVVDLSAPVTGMSESLAAWAEHALACAHGFSHGNVGNMETARLAIANAAIGNQMSTAQRRWFAIMESCAGPAPSVGNQVSPGLI